MRNQTDSVDPCLVVARNLKALRKARELTQEQLAEKAELHVNYVGGIERGERNATIRNIKKLAKALGVPMSVLVDESATAPSAQP
ncbi:helix-turn-helix transcriptional regulator [Uliginosibacterium sp. 31-16]|uniref:helix-turn-helix domain-containing protein n=1 Tax=Uliginosibacterium sp. 31-16 TaxID=3068315 RepID=UPI00273E475F|nr:helix-turn-helix transcriptional regulator [Uliginosibacterium sp. 31-16]MDP5239132.1 helix-turn-helix transcriptional regulator [Uliginosibacterium sp. 31-16]